MDRSSFLKYVKSDENQFETFCHKALPLCELEGDAARHYRRASKQAPYDGETGGAYRGVNGRIVFEYKSSDDLAKIKSDLLGDTKRKGKLRATADEGDKSLRLYLVVTLGKRTHPFLTAIRKYLKDNALPFEFECLDEADVAMWLEKNPRLLHEFTPELEKRTVDSFIGILKQQKAPVDFPQYRRFDEVYVPPREYDQILDILERRGVVFVVGPPHVGKTFTAASILLHYYQNGRRDPRWVLAKPLEPEPEPGQHRIDQVGEPKESMTALIASNIGYDKVTYVEDIFGRTCEEEVGWIDHHPELLLKEILSYVTKDAHDARVIITSREMIFLKALDGASELSDLVVRIEAGVKMGVGSYSESERQRILRRYGRLHACVWSEIDSTKLPSDVLLAATNLQTPQAIELYCRLAKLAGTPLDRQGCLDQASLELTKAFTNEIAALPEHVCAVLLTSEYFDGDFPLFAIAFPRIAGNDPPCIWKHAAEVLADRVLVRSMSCADYVHPSYKEAIALAVHTTKVRQMFEAMMSNLSGCPDSAVRLRVALCLSSSKGVQDDEGLEVRMLLNLTEDHNPVVRGMATLGLRWKPNGGSANAISMLARDEDPVVRCIAAAKVAEGFRDHDSLARGLLLGLAEDKSPIVRSIVAEWLAMNYGALDDMDRRVVLDLGRDTEASVRSIVARRLLGIPDQLDDAARELLRDAMVKPGGNALPNRLSVQIGGAILTVGPSFASKHHVPSGNPDA